MTILQEILKEKQEVWSKRAECLSRCTDKESVESEFELSFLSLLPPLFISKNHCYDEKTGFDYRRLGAYNKCFDAFFHTFQPVLLQLKNQEIIDEQQYHKFIYKLLKERYEIMQQLNELDSCSNFWDNLDNNSSFSEKWQQKQEEIEITVYLLKQIIKQYGNIEIADIQKIPEQELKGLIKKTFDSSEFKQQFPDIKIEYDEFELDLTHSFNPKQKDNAMKVRKMLNKQQKKWKTTINLLSQLSANDALNADKIETIVSLLQLRLSTMAIDIAAKAHYYDDDEIFDYRRLGCFEYCFKEIFNNIQQVCLQLKEKEIIDSNQKDKILLPLLSEYLEAKEIVDDSNYVYQDNNEIPEKINELTQWVKKQKKNNFDEVVDELETTFAEGEEKIEEIAQSLKEGQKAIKQFFKLFE